MTRYDFSRRQFLQMGGATLLVTAVGANCSADGGDLPEGGEKGLEAPMLADRVEAGDLPPLEERLPDQPLVVEPSDRVGVYGGTWHQVLHGIGESAWLYMCVGYDQLIHWNPEWTGHVPNIAESWEVSDDGLAYTFYLRPGMKWSDGEPFSASDIEFAYNDILQDPDVGPIRGFRAGRELATFEKIDDVSFRFVFPAPPALFLNTLAGPDGQNITLWPRHYLEQFHKKYNPDADQLAEDEGFADWVQLLDSKASFAGAFELHWQNLDKPTLAAWKITNALGDGTTLTLERNPYYWKVDPDGSQLPYLDHVTFDIVNDPEVSLLKATNGEIDFDVRQVYSLPNRPVLADSAEQGDYRLIDTTDVVMNYLCVYLNMTHPDPVKREIFQNKDFRIGLSHAINREEMSNSIFQRQGEPWQACPLPRTGFENETLAKQYTEYDVATANDQLDLVGLTTRDGDGFRLGPDGNRVSIVLDVTTGPRPYQDPEAAQMIADYWREVGIDARIESMDRTLQVERRDGNQHDATIWGGDGGLDPLQDPRNYVPVHPESNYAVAWSLWYRNAGESGEEPPERVREQMDVWDQVQVAANEADRDSLFTQVLEIAQEQFYVIGTLLPGPGFGIVKNNFHNVPEPTFYGWQWPSPGPAVPSQFFQD